MLRRIIAILLVAAVLLPGFLYTALAEETTARYGFRFTPDGSHMVRVSYTDAVQTMLPILKGAHGDAVTNVCRELPGLLKNLQLTVEQYNMQSLRESMIHQQVDEMGNMEISFDMTNYYNELKRPIINFLNINRKQIQDLFNLFYLPVYTGQVIRTLSTMDLSRVYRGKIRIGSLNNLEEGAELKGQVEIDDNLITWDGAMTKSTVDVMINVNGEDYHVQGVKDDEAKIIELTVKRLLEEEETELLSFELTAADTGAAGTLKVNDKTYFITVDVEGAEAIVWKIYQDTMDSEPVMAFQLYNLPGDSYLISISAAGKQYTLRIDNQVNVKSVDFFGPNKHFTMTVNNVSTPYTDVIAVLYQDEKNGYSYQLRQNGFVYQHSVMVNGVPQETERVELSINMDTELVGTGKPVMTLTIPGHRLEMMAEEIDQAKCINVYDNGAWALGVEIYPVETEQAVLPLLPPVEELAGTYGGGIAPAIEEEPAAVTPGADLEDDDDNTKNGDDSGSFTRN